MNTHALTRTLTRTLLAVLVVLVPLMFVACSSEPADAPMNEQMEEMPMNEQMEGMDGGMMDGQSMQARMENGVQVIEVTVGQEGYTPQQIRLQAGVPARLVFTRTTDQTCATQIKVPAMGVGPVELPLNEPTPVEFTPGEAGTFAFTCGMDMVSGSLFVQS